MEAQSIANSRHEVVSVVLLVFVTSAWGTTFLLVKHVTQTMSVMGFLAMRFWIASGVLLVLRPRSLLRIAPHTLRHGSLLGLALAGGYVFQTIGLRYTSAALSGFLTGLTVVLTPMLAWPLLRHRPTGSTIAAVAVAVLGLGVLSLNRLNFGLGEALSIIGALGFALQIVGLGAWSTGEDVYALALLQLIMVALCCTIGTAPHFGLLPTSELAWFGVVATAVVATALAFVVQTWAQSYISPTRTAIIFTLEPIIAGLTAWLGGEHLSAGTIAGGTMVIIAMLIDEVGYRFSGRLRRLS